MKKRYNYLQDEKAVEEILRHKWIESQKHGRDIGFITAAWDWIQKFGQDWQKYQQINNQQLSELMERRRYRRFKNKFSAKIILGNKKYSVIIKDLNYEDICFLSSSDFSNKNHLVLNITFDNQRKSSRLSLSINLKKAIKLYRPKNPKLPYLYIASFEKMAQQEIVNNRNGFLN